MTLSVIKDSVYSHLEAEAGLLPLFFENVNATVPESNHLRPSVLPSNTSSLGLNHTDQEIGTIQVLVYIEKGQGEIIGPTEGQKVLDAFPRNTELTGLRIDNIGTIAPSFNDDGNWQITPVSIPYQFIS